MIERTYIMISAPIERSEEENAALKELRLEMAPFGVMIEESEGAEFKYLRVVVDPADQVREHPSGKPLSGLGLGSEAVSVMARLFPRTS